jgi:hypothetical protein
LHKNKDETSTLHLKLENIIRFHEQCALYLKPCSVPKLYRQPSSSISPASSAFAAVESQVVAEETILHSELHFLLFGTRLG